MFSKKQNGFTIVEVIVSLSIFSIITSLFVVYIYRSYQSYHLFTNSSTTQEEARRVLNIMVKELRSAKESDNGDFPLAEVNPYSLTFYANIDSEEDTEKVRYFLQGTDLKKNVIKPSGDTYLGPGTESTICHNVINTTDIFKYYDKNYTGSEDPLGSPVDLNDVTFIKISLMIDDNPSEPPAAQEFESAASLRNLKTNLSE